MKEELLFFGDFFYDFDGFAEDLEAIANWIKENQFQTILNLEGGFWGEEAYEIKKRGAHLHSSLHALDALDKLSTAGVCLANNHMMDYGEMGLEHTIALLDEKKILHTGAGKNLVEAKKAFELNAGNTKITVLNFGWDEEETVTAKKDSAGCAPRFSKLILSEIAAWKKKKAEDEKLVVCIHWGYEYNRLPQPLDVKLGHAMIDAGADLVIGHHPHVMQPKEIYNGKRIYYSMGDFYFSSRRVRHNRQFKETIPCQCDYGLGVIWNPDLDSFREVLLHYNRKEGRSEIIAASDMKNSDKKAMSCTLEDISEKNLFSREYISEVKKRKRNINPVLTGDKKRDQRKLKNLALKRKIRRVIKKIVGK